MLHTLLLVLLSVVLLVEIVLMLVTHVRKDTFGSALHGLSAFGDGSILAGVFLLGVSRPLAGYSKSIAHFIWVCYELIGMGILILIATLVLGYRFRNIRGPMAQRRAASLANARQKLEDTHSRYSEEDYLRLKTLLNEADVDPKSDEFWARMSEMMQIERRYMTDEQRAKSDAALAKLEQSRSRINGLSKWL